MGEKNMCWPGFFAAQLCINYLMHWTAMLFLILLSPVKVSLGETCVNRALAAGVYKAPAHLLGSITYCCLQGQDRCNVILLRAPFSTSTSALLLMRFKLVLYFCFYLDRNTLHSHVGWNQIWKQISLRLNYTSQTHNKFRENYIS